MNGTRSKKEKNQLRYAWPLKIQNNAPPDVAQENSYIHHLCLYLLSYLVNNYQQHYPKSVLLAPFIKK